MMPAELQLEGLVGPTHNYAGLGLGNLASQKNAQSIANPRKAALQSLELMHWLNGQNVPIAVMPPQTRPRLDILHTLGFSGSIGDQLAAAHSASPVLLRAIWSASSMWTANAATVTSKNENSVENVHVTPANLLSSLHRVLEYRETEHFLRQIFHDSNYFTVHPPLNVTTRLADEGAANHMRLCDSEDTKSIDCFIYGSKPPNSVFPARIMPRQQHAASFAVAENHQLQMQKTVFFQQHPDAIDAGVFHHDVIGMSHRSVMILHEKALLEQAEATHALKKLAPWLTIREIREDELSLADSVATYFFNAQLVTVSDGTTAILFPQECAENRAAQALARQLVDELPQVTQVAFFDLRESMKNGGGPACLRLRFPLSENALSAVHSGVRFHTKRYHQLQRFIENRYRDRVEPKDLLDPTFAEEVLQTQRDLVTLLELKPISFSG